MSRSQLILTLLAAVSMVVHLFSETFGPQGLVYVFKPLTMVFIITMALMGMKRTRIFYDGFIFLGLFFSLMGDILLMLPSNLFLQGLVSFLIAHIFYILAFSKGVGLRLKGFSWLPFMIFGLLIYGFMFPSLKEMAIPVLAYILVILTMGWRAYERWSQNKIREAMLAMRGAILFIISDSVLGINRFRFPFQLSTLVVLAAYFPAQWLIALSAAVGEAEPTKNK